MDKEQAYKIGLAFKLGMIYAKGKAHAKLTNDSKLAFDEPQWVTVHSHGKGQKSDGSGEKGGSHVLIESTTGQILGGMGQHNGKTIKQLKKENKQSKQNKQSKNKTVSKKDSASKTQNLTTKANTTSVGPQEQNYTKKLYSKLDNKSVSKILTNPLFGDEIVNGAKSLKEGTKEGQSLLEKARKEAETRFKPTTIDKIQEMDSNEYVKKFDQNKWLFQSNKGQNDIDPTLNVTSDSQHLAQYLNINDKPKVVSKDEFEKLAKDNNATMMYRTVDGVNGLSGEEINNITRYGEKTYYGNGVYGDGIYFADDLNESKTYGKSEDAHTMRAFIDKSKAKILTHKELTNLMSQYYEDTGEYLEEGQATLIALREGYNVIEIPRKDKSTYFNVLDRGVLVCEE